MTNLLVKPAHYNILPKIRFTYLSIVFLIFLGLFTSCSSPADLPDFDEKAWQKDVLGCQNIRPALAPILIKNKSQLMNLNHTDIISLLGKPEGNSLEKSGEREYTYFIQPGNQCQNKNQPSKASKIFIRFDALDRVYKIRVADES